MSSCERLSALALITLGLACSDTSPTQQPGADAALADSAVQEATPADCIAAETEAECQRVDLPPLQDCDDCGHQCTWMVLHEVERSGDRCSYGEAGGVCTYVQHGESAGVDLAGLCSGEFSESGVWVDRTGSKPRIGFQSFGSVTRPGLERCRSDEDPFALLPECRCPCLPDYPDAECRALPQGFTSERASGFEECPGVPRHRAEAVSCEDQLEALACDSDRGTCSEDTDCDDGLRCLENNDFCSCVKHCTRDADCAEGEACACRTGHAPSTCVPSLCSTDADCDSGDVCALSVGAVDAQGGCEPKALACRAPFVDCDGTLCARDEHCAFDLGMERWQCADSDRCE